MSAWASSEPRPRPSASRSCARRSLVRRLSAPRLNYSIDVRSGGLAVKGVVQGEAHMPCTRMVCRPCEKCAKSGVLVGRACNARPSDEFCLRIQFQSRHPCATRTQDEPGPERCPLSHSQVPWTPSTGRGPSRLLQPRLRGHASVEASEVKRQILTKPSSPAVASVCVEASGLKLV